MVIDQMARLKPADGPEHQTWRRVIDLLKRENYWVMLSNGVRMSRARGRDDVVAIGRALYEVAPTRSIFGTDWPHAHSHNEGGGPEEAQLIALLYRFLPVRRRARRCWSTTRHGCMDSDDGGENPSIAVRSSISGEARRVILEVTDYRARWASRANGLQLRANGR